MKKSFLFVIYQFGILVPNPVSSNLLRPSRALQQIAISYTHLLIIIVDNLLTLKLKGLSHEMDLASDDSYGSSIDLGVVVPDKNVSNLAYVRKGAILSPFRRIRNLHCDSQRRMRLPIEGGGGGGGGGGPEQN